MGQLLRQLRTVFASSHRERSIPTTRRIAVPRFEKVVMGSIFGHIGEETPKFDPVETSESGYEIRRYHATRAIEANDSHHVVIGAGGGFG